MVAVSCSNGHFEVKVWVLSRWLVERRNHTICHIQCRAHFWSVSVLMRTVTEYDEYAMRSGRTSLPSVSGQT